jgi:hypothetical protein
MPGLLTCPGQAHYIGLLLAYHRILDQREGGLALFVIAGCNAGLTHVKVERIVAMKVALQGSGRNQG